LRFGFDEIDQKNGRTRDRIQPPRQAASFRKFNLSSLTFASPPLLL
jgi:hypothetical protein